MLTLIVLSLVALVALAAALIAAWRLAPGLPERPPVRWVVFAWALLAGTTLDLTTKVYAFAHLPQVGDSVPQTAWFSFTHARNEGAAFGMFQGQHTFFMLVTVFAVVAVPYFVQAARQRVALTAAVMGLILSGVLGNFWDRVVHGYVRDFLDVHTPPSGALYDLCMRLFDTHVWPTFNVADVFITCGAVSVVVLLGHVTEDPAQDEAATDGPAGRAAQPPEPPAEDGSAQAPVNP